MIPITFIIETPNFVLRIPNEKDIPFVFSATRHSGFNDGMVWDAPENMEQLKQPLINNIAAWKNGEGYSFTIERKDSKDFLGRISIRKTNINDVWNVGFWTHPEEQGKGIMTEALQFIIRFAFTKLTARRIEAYHAIWNKPSEKVLKNNGFTFVQFLEKGFQKKGKWVAENLMAIDYKNWQD